MAAAMDANFSAEISDLDPTPLVFNDASALSRVCLAIAYTCSCSLAAPEIPPGGTGVPVTACSAALSEDEVRFRGLVRSFFPPPAPFAASCSTLRSKPCLRSSRALPASRLISESITCSASMSKPDDCASLRVVPNSESKLAKSSLGILSESPTWLSKDSTSRSMSRLVGSCAAALCAARSAGSSLAVNTLAISRRRARGTKRADSTAFASFAARTGSPDVAAVELPETPAPIQNSREPGSAAANGPPPAPSGPPTRTPPRTSPGPRGAAVDPAARAAAWPTSPRDASASTSSRYSEGTSPCPPPSSSMSSSSSSSSWSMSSSSSESCIRSSHATRHRPRDIVEMISPTQSWWTSRTRSPICKPWCDASSAAAAPDLPAPDSPASTASFFFPPSIVAGASGAYRCANAFSVAWSKRVTAAVVPPEPSTAHARIKTSASDKRSSIPSLKHKCATRGVLGEKNQSTSRDAMSMTGRDAAAEVDVAPATSPGDSLARGLRSAADDLPAGVSVATPRPSVLASNAGRFPCTSASTAPSRSAHAAYTDAMHRRHSWCKGTAASSLSRETSAGTNASPGCSLLTWHRPCISVSASSALAMRPSL